MIVEAHTVGQDDWTTLPDQNGNTSTDVGESCAIDWRSLHPFLDSYQTVGDDPGTPDTETCYPTGTTGEWNGATGNSGGYDEWSIDLSDYAGEQVEISISYVQDFAFSGLGVFVDDAAVTVDGAVVDQTSFETDFGGFEAGPPPAGSEAGTSATGSAAARSATWPGRAWRPRTRSLGASASRACPTPRPDGGDGRRDALPGRPRGDAPPEEPPPGGGPDTQAPNTKITKGPKRKSSKAKAKFKFRSNEAGSTFECRLDDGEFEDCDSPQKYRGLDPGRHRFRVRATDAAGTPTQSGQVPLEVRAEEVDS